MLPPLGATPPHILILGDIFEKYQRISTKISEMSQRWVLGEHMLKYVSPSPHLRLK